MRTTTVAALLVESHPGCVAHARSSVDRFCKDTVARYGMWFEVALAADPRELSADDSRYVLMTWRQWLEAEGLAGCGGGA